MQRESGRTRRERETTGVGAVYPYFHQSKHRCVQIPFTVNTEKVYHRQNFCCASYNILKCRIWNCLFSFCLPI
uniref:Uncharacterized protein n=1 Tax=Arundo donax TaxID=35708 RepID=A0A0A9C7C0_ARUDO